VEMDNDANVGALGEVAYGAGRGLQDVVYVKVATGLGAGLVLGGRLHTGSIGIAGEIGHVTVDPDGALCACGNRGCLQTVAAAPHLLAQLRVAHRGEVTLRDLLDLVAAGDWAARRAVADSGRAIGRVLGDICNCLNPQAIIVGGELSAAGEPLLAGIREGIDRHALPSAAEAVEVRPGMLGDRAEVLGALSLVIADSERLRSVGLAALHEPVGTSG
ncbi:MAG TPA: ROK family protein, partial [Gaiellaceae bacterium]